MFEQVVMAAGSVGALQAALDAAFAVEPAGVAAGELLGELTGLLAVRDRLDALITRRLQMVAAIDATVTETGLGPRSWLVREGRLAPYDAARRVFVARHLHVAPELAAAFDAGEVGLDHARHLSGLLADLPPEQRADAEPVLVAAARQLDPLTVGRLTRQVRAQVGGEDTAAAAAERRYDSRWLSVDPTIDGMVSVAGMLDPATGEALLAALAPLTPRRGPEDIRTAGQRRADALAELVEHALAADTLPDSGGSRPRIVVTLDFDTLSGTVRDTVRDHFAHGPTTTTGGSTTGGSTTGGSGPWPEGGRGSWPRLEHTGAEITPAEARRLACDAAILPAVLRGDSEILDLGRATRLWSPAIRRAARLRDQGCCWPGCDVPLARCDLHHLHFWADGGPTSLANCAHLCRFHHRLIHQDSWQLHRDPTGKLILTPPGHQPSRASPRPRAA